MILRTGLNGEEVIYPLKLKSSPLMNKMKFKENQVFHNNDDIIGVEKYCILISQDCILRSYESGFIGEEEYKQRKNELISLLPTSSYSFSPAQLSDILVRSISLEISN